MDTIIPYPVKQKIFGRSNFDASIVHNVLGRTPHHNLNVHRPRILKSTKFQKQFSSENFSINDNHTTIYLHTYNNTITLHTHSATTKSNGTRNSLTILDTASVRDSRNVTLHSLVNLLHYPLQCNGKSMASLRKY